MLEHQQPPTLGEYIRRLRKQKRWSLQRLAAEAGLSYHNVSRIENDSTVPSPDSVAALADALGGDLKWMLEQAGTLPRTILDRIAERNQGAGSTTLRRSAWAPQPGQPRGGGQDAGSQFGQLAAAAGLDPAESQEVGEAIERLMRLQRTQRSAVIDLIRSLAAEESDEQK